MKDTTRTTDYDGFALPGLSLRRKALSASLPNALSANVFAFTDEALMPAAALRVRASAQPDGTEKALRRTGSSEAWRRGLARRARTRFLITTGSGNVGSGQAADMAAAGFAAQAAAELAEAGAPGAPFLHFAAGAPGRHFEVGRTVALLREALRSQPFSHAPAQPGAACAVLLRTVPFLFPSGGAQFAAALFTGGALGFGAKTLVAATDLPVSDRVLEFIADRLWLHAFGRWPGRESLGDALLLLATGCAAESGIAPIDSPADARIPILGAGFRATMFPSLRTPAVFPAAASGLLRPLPLRFVLSGAAQTGEAERIRRSAAMRLAAWRAALQPLEPSSELTVASLSALHAALWSALFVDAGIPGLERTPIEIRLNDAPLVSGGSPVPLIAVGRLDASAAASPAGAFSAWFERTSESQAELTVEMMLGRGAVSCDARL